MPINVKKIVSSAMVILLTCTLSGCITLGNAPDDVVLGKKSSTPPHPKSFDPAAHEKTTAKNYEKHARKDVCMNVRSVRGAPKVLDATTLIYNAGRFDYRVETKGCRLEKFDHFALSQGPEKIVTHGSRPIYASQLFDGHICGFKGDLLYASRHQDIREPGTPCKITHVRRLDK